jgi:homoserine kinase
VFRLTLPATSANLGPAFDAAALAFSLFLKIEAREAEAFSIRATGRDATICGAIERNLMLNTYEEVLRENGRAVPRLAIRVKNEIPIGKGCGSSAAARLAGIALANLFGKLRWSDQEIIEEAARREHHADNAAACWLGGLAVAGRSREGRPQFTSVRLKGKWPLLLVVPKDALSTEEARRMLPDAYAREDVVSNIQNSMLLLSAFLQGRSDLLKVALEDRIHQPYRAEACPLLPALAKMGDNAAVLGVALSGAGPSVMVFVNPKASVMQARKAVLRELEGCGLAAELITTQILPAGSGHRYA